MFDRRQLIAGTILAIIIAGSLLITPDMALATLSTLVASPWFPIVLVGLYLLRPIVAWPITILSALVGFRYGFLIGVPVALAGAVLTSLPAYAAGRYFRADTGWLGHVTTGGDTYFRTAGDLRGVIAARLVPTPPEAISAGAGVAHVPLAAFVLGTVIGELPWTIAAVTIGVSLQSATAINSIGFDPLLILGGVLAGILLLAGPLYRRYHTSPDDR